jgi:hypothetical protein
LRRRRTPIALSLWHWLVGVGLRGFRAQQVPRRLELGEVVQESGEHGALLQH